MHFPFTYSAQISFINKIYITQMNDICAEYVNGKCMGWCPNTNPNFKIKDGVITCCDDKRWIF